MVKVKSIEILEGEFEIECIPPGGKVDVFGLKLLNAKESSYPDIDYDVSNNEKVRSHIIEKWGEDNVAYISNWNSLQLRSLIKDLSKFYDIPFIEVNAVTNIMLKEATPKIKEARGIKAGILDPPATFEELIEHSISLQRFLEKYSQVSDHIKNLVRQIRSASTHAGGIIISQNLPERMPLIRSKGKSQSPWSEGQNVRHLEPLGFLKFDVLGLSTLEMFEDTIKFILQRHNGIEKPTFEQVKEWYDQHLHPDKINFNDQKVYEFVFDDGNFIGVFQFAEKGIQHFAKQVKPKSLEEVSAISSIWRPGPLCLSKNTTITTRFRRIEKDNTRQTSNITIEKLFDVFHHNKSIGRETKIISLDTKTLELKKNKVLNVFFSGKKPVYKLKFQKRVGKEWKFCYFETDGSNERGIVEATEDHKFLTLDGWKALNKLQLGDYVCALVNKFKEKEDNRNKKNFVYGKKNFKNLAFRTYQYRCLFCNWLEGSLDVNHLDGNRFVDNHPNNLCFLCPNHHRMYSEGVISKEQILEIRKNFVLPKTNNVMFLRFVSKEFIGVEDTYDIEMENPYNNFLAGELIVHNSAQVDKDFVKAKQNPKKITYVHPIVEEVLGKNYGFIIYQEDLAWLAHKLGMNVSLEEGNLLRKVLTKKGTGKGHEVKDTIKYKFMMGCLTKGIEEKDAEDLWSKMEYFSQYGFNRSHSLCYSIISFQCAHLLTYFPAEWICGILNRTSLDDQEDMINNVKTLGFEVLSVDINSSGLEWTPSKTGQSIVPPLDSVKGLGESAMETIFKHRPYKTIEEVLFGEGKINKTPLSALIRAGALYDLMDDRFINLKHFWKASADDKPKNQKKFEENIEKYRNEPDFTREEIIENAVSLTGNFPYDLIVDRRVQVRLKEQNVIPISKYEPGDNVVWFIVRKKEEKQTKFGKTYWVLDVIDQTGKTIKIKCWSVSSKDVVHVNRPYVASVEWDENYGFSIRSVHKQMKLVG